MKSGPPGLSLRADSVAKAGVEPQSSYLHNPEGRGAQGIICITREGRVYRARQAGPLGAFICITQWGGELSACHAGATERSFA